MNSQFVSDIVYGGVDGMGTTFAVMIAAIGSNQSNLTVITLGLANIFADGFSMGVSAYSSVLDNDNSMTAPQKGIITYISFCLMGAILVIVYYFNQHHNQTKKQFILTITVISCLFIIGTLKHNVTVKNSTWNESMICGLKTSLLGAMIGGISYIVAKTITEYNDIPQMHEIDNHSEFYNN